MTLKWSSNKADVADRAYTICRVVNGQIEIMPDPKAGRFVPVYIDAEVAPVDFPPDESAQIEFTVEPK